jgi:hypothetical protein
LSEQVTVLYIGGAGRSGSTILAQLLGQIPGFVNVGELWQVWDRGLQENEPCGCGRPFRSCGFWNAVGEEAFGGWNNVDVGKMVAFKPFLKRLRYTPHFALAAATGIYSQRVDELLRECGPILERLHRAIQSVSGAKVIVDSSKQSSYSVLLNEVPVIDLRVLHLIRDSRAVAYSWSKNKLRTEIAGRRVQMPRLSSVSASRAWNISNYRYTLPPVSASFSRLRYEDLVGDPALYIGTSLTELGFEGEVGRLHFTHGRAISLAVDHTVSGNPSRFRTGTIELRPDEEWKVRMKRMDKSIVTALTAPLLVRYGYLRKDRTAK